MPWNQFQMCSNVYASLIFCRHVCPHKSISQMILPSNFLCHYSFWMNKTSILGLLLQLKVDACKLVNKLPHAQWHDSPHRCHMWSPWHTRPDLELDSSHANVTQLNWKIATSGEVSKLINFTAYMSRISASRTTALFMSTGSLKADLTFVVTNCNWYQCWTGIGPISKKEAPFPAELVSLKKKRTTPLHSAFSFLHEVSYKWCLMLLSTAQSMPMPFLQSDSPFQCCRLKAEPFQRY